METFMNYSDFFLRLVNIVVIGYGFYRFMGKPHSDLEERVKVLEVKVKEHDDSLNQGKDNFREQKKTDALIITSLVALIEFETDYCMHHGDERISPRLEESKNNLQSYLAEK